MAAGAAVALLVRAARRRSVRGVLLLAGLGVHLLLDPGRVLDAARRPRTPRAAAHIITRGPLPPRFWVGGRGRPRCVLAVRCCVVAASGVASALAGSLALVGLCLWDESGCGPARASR